MLGVRNVGGTEKLEFPWGQFQLGYANINETYDYAGPHYLKQTSAVGLYPQGRSPFGALDMAGNVWEWCLNEYDQPERKGMEGEADRVVRGGSWRSLQDGARCAVRFGYRPGDRNCNLGFRVVLCSAPVV